MVQLDERKRSVLQAVVDEYTRSAEPVGSEHPVMRERLRVSPATIRGAMASLEEMGLLTHPHTSAGRVPTDKGYRIYVDIFLEDEQPAASDRQVIRRRIHGAAAEPAGAAEQAARVLAAVTHYASVVASPGISHQTIRSLHLVPFGAERALAVVATDAGNVQGRVVALPKGVEPDDLERLASALAARLRGARASELTQARLEREIGEASWIDRVLEELRGWLQRDEGGGAVGAIHVEGARHLLREPEFRHPDVATQMLELLEERSVLADVLAAATRRPGVWISIGQENRREELRAYSLVMAAFTSGDEAAGTVGIVGPTRMRYRQVVAAVRYAAERLSETLRALE